MAGTGNPTACILVIGNEVLSGRTQDANIRFLAQRLGDIGIPVREVRIIPDVAETIIGTINEVRARYDQVFTTGGIGPTASMPPASAWRRCPKGPR
jgi:molybdopterin-biosynthesis enzyme MoeA-like protein